MPRLNLDALAVTSFVTSAAPVAQIPTSTGGEDCFTFPRPTFTITHTG
jgi:hypothetical protein